MRRFLVTVLAVVLMSACAGDGAGSDSGGPPASSGVRGVVVAGPRCPVVVQGSPCPDQPWSGTVRVTTAQGEQVAETQTDGRGAFLIELDAGSYEVLPLTDDAGLTTAAPQRIVVEEGAFTRVTLTVDTGIR